MLRWCTAQRFVQWIQILLALAATVFPITILLAPKNAGHAYIARIDCAHLDVAEGLYKSLRSSVSSYSIIDDSDDDDDDDSLPGTPSNSHGTPADSSLTNSEINILTQYAEAQVALAPQFITTLLWSWCYGDYNVSDYFDSSGNHKYHIENVVQTCTKTQSNLLDYRRELNSIGLEAILAYAFKSSKFEDSAYADAVASRTKRFLLVVPGIVFSAVSQCIVLVATLVLYSRANHGLAFDRPVLLSDRANTTVPRFLVHGVALVSFALCMALIISAGITTHLINEIRNEIHSHLNDFGVYLHAGILWFLLLWTGTAFAILSMMSWAFPSWCANPSVDDDVYDDDVSVTQPFVEESPHKFKDMFHIHRHSKNEIELRRLGEKLAKKTSVRRTRSKRMPESEGLLDPHYRETTFDGYQERRMSANESVLNEDEMVFLDQGSLLNKLRDERS